MRKKIAIYSFTAIVTLISMLVGALIIENFTINQQVFLEYSTGWITLFMVGLCVVFSFDFERFIHLSVKFRIFNIIANSSIFIMYAAYLLIDYGLFHPHVSAIGFNISEILRNIVIFNFMFMSKYI